MNKTSGPAQAMAGGTVTYTLIVTNISASGADGTTVSDPIPTGLTNYRWTCSASGGAVCPAASGRGALNQTIAIFPGNSAVTYQIVARVSATPPATITNTASSTPPGGRQVGGGLCAPGNTPPPCTGATTITPASVSMIPIPSLGFPLLALLALLLAGCGAMNHRRLERSQ